MRQEICLYHGHKNLNIHISCWYQTILKIRENSINFVWFGGTEDAGILKVHGLSLIWAAQNSLHNWCYVPNFGVKLESPHTLCWCLCLKFVVVLTKKFCRDNGNCTYNLEFPLCAEGRITIVFLSHSFWMMWQISYTQKRFLLKPLISWLYNYHR
jgi:hypothetical protein